MSAARRERSVGRRATDACDLTCLRNLNQSRRARGRADGSAPGPRREFHERPRRKRVRGRAPTAIGKCASNTHSRTHTHTHTWTHTLHTRTHAQTRRGASPAPVFREPGARSRLLPAALARPPLLPAVLPGSAAAVAFSRLPPARAALCRAPLSFPGAERRDVNGRPRFALT